MIVYKGVRRQPKNIVTVTRESLIKELDPRIDLYDHRPDDFEWGYCGAGPAHLTLAILADYLKNDDMAFQLIQNFTLKMTSQIQSDEWTMTSKQIDVALGEAIN